MVGGAHAGGFGRDDEGREQVVVELGVDQSAFEVGRGPVKIGAVRGAFGGGQDFAVRAVVHDIAHLDGRGRLGDRVRKEIAAQLTAHLRLNVLAPTVSVAFAVAAGCAVWKSVIALTAVGSAVFKTGGKVAPERCCLWRRSKSWRQLHRRQAGVGRRTKRGMECREDNLDRRRCHRQKRAKTSWWSRKPTNARDVSQCLRFMTG